MIDTGALRKEIINLAVQGKLVSQKSDEGATEDIYDLLRKKGKKTFADILEENMPFSIPNSWRWGTLSDLTFDNELNDGNWVLKEDMVDFGPVKLIQLGNIGDCKYIEKGYKYLTEEHFLELNGRQIYPGYLLINRLVVKDMYSCIIPDVKGILMTAVDVCWVAPNIEHYNIEYIMYALSSNDFRNKVQSLGHGVTRFRISKTNLINIAFPIPPISEQNRIVKKIKELFKLLDRIDALQTQYSSDLEVLKSKIIDAGIQGKLTEQLPEDGTAEELSKNHIDDIINQEEKILDIPSNWSWIKLGWAMEIERGGSPRPIKAFVTDADDGINWIKIGDVAKDGKYIYQTKEKIKPEGEQKSRKVYPGDFLLTNSMSFGRPYISKIEGCIHDGWLLLRNTNELFDLDYLYWLLSSGYAFKQFSKKAAGATVDNLNKDKVASAVIPLPPLSEQKRIANVLEEIMNKL